MAKINMKLESRHEPNDDECGYDFDKPSRAVVANDSGGKGLVLWYVGGHLNLEISEAGMGPHLDELGLDDAPDGISVWEGIYTYKGSSRYGLDEGAESSPKGSFRPPTDEEWAHIRLGQCPWNVHDWLKKEKTKGKSGNE